MRNNSDGWSRILRSLKHAHCSGSSRILSISPGLRVIKTIFQSNIYTYYIRYILWSWCRPPVLHISPKTGTVGVPCHGLCWIWMIYNRKTVRCRRPPGTCDMVTIVTATKSIRNCIYAKIYGMCSAAWVLMKREYAIMDWLTDCWTEVIARGKDRIWKG